MKKKKQVTLVVEHGRLHTQYSDIVDDLMRSWYTSNPVIMCRHPEGDFDPVLWPMEKDSRKKLASVLYDDREMGMIPDVESVILPDGSEFFIEEELKD